MGVKACDRNGCESIMCDVYHEKHGYICYKCLTELENTPPRTPFIYQHIKDFMSSRKEELEIQDWKGYISNVFKDHTKEDDRW